MKQQKTDINVENQKNLCLSLLLAEDEESIIKILDEHGYSLNNESAWHPLGDNAGNFSTIGNQQADPTAALIEKIVNSVDAVLLAECYKNGIVPDSEKAPKTMSEAVEKFLNVTEGRLDFLDASQQTKLAENIRFMVTGEKSSPCINIIDFGEGQTPNNFKNTFLSTTSQSPKIKIPFVQGKFNAGSTGSLQFCGRHNIQLILSRRNPHCPVSDSDNSGNDWGFTIIRRKRAQHGEKASVFMYLAPNGEIPRFSTDSLDLLPTRSSANNPGKPYAVPVSYGTCVKLYNYRWPGKSIATTDGRKYLEKFIQAPCLPFRIHETRAYKANYYDTTVIGILNKIQGENIDDNSGDLEKGFPADLMISIPDIGKLKLKICVWKDGLDLRNVPTGVFFLVNGQVHGDCGSDFIARRTDHSYIEKHIFVAVDCTETDRDFHEDTFMPSRDRLRDNEHTKYMKKHIADEIKDHPGLKEINAFRKQQLREKATENNENVINLFNDLIKSDPSLRAVLGLGGHIIGGVGPGKIDIFKGKKFPTYFKLANQPKDGLIKSCPINRTVSIVCETDAENNYFSRPNEPGELQIIPSYDLIESSRLWNGRFNLKFRVPWNAKVGEKTDVKIIVSDNVNTAKPFECEFQLVASAAVTKITPPGPGPNPPGDENSPDPDLNKPKFGLPNPQPVHKADWEKYGFASSVDALRVKKSDDGYDFYWNVDNKYLIHETANNKNDIELIKQWFSWGLTIAALSLIKKQKEESEDENIGVDLTSVEKACDALSMVIIPIIRTLHDMPLSKV